MNHILISFAFWLSGAVADFFVTRAYWKVNDCWGNPMDYFLAAVVALTGSWFGVFIGIMLMGPPWKPNKII